MTASAQRFSTLRRQLTTVALVLAYMPSFVALRVFRSELLSHLIHHRHHFFVAAYALSSFCTVTIALVVVTLMLLRKKPPPNERRLKWLLTLNWLPHYLVVFFWGFSNALRFGLVE